MDFVKADNHFIYREVHLDINEANFVVDIEVVHELDFLEIIRFEELRVNLLVIIENYFKVIVVIFYYNFYDFFNNQDFFEKI